MSPKVPIFERTMRKGGVRDSWVCAATRVMHQARAEPCATVTPQQCQSAILWPIEFHTEHSMSNRPSFRLLARRFAATAVLCGTFAAPALLTAQQPYHIVDRWKIGGDGGWDYLLVDSPAHRLYLTRG